MPRAARLPNGTAARNRRERTRLLAQRDRLGNRSKFAAATIERAEERIAALAVEIADVDRRILELDALKAAR
jgi:hypothetical protein